jgi:hypothetical protein
MGQRALQCLADGRDYPLSWVLDFLCSAAIGASRHGIDIGELFVLAAEAMPSLLSAESQKEVRTRAWKLACTLIEVESPVFEQLYLEMVLRGIAEAGDDASLEVVGVMAMVAEKLLDIYGVVIVETLQDRLRDLLVAGMRWSVDDGNPDRQNVGCCLIKVCVVEERYDLDPRNMQEILGIIPSLEPERKAVMLELVRRFWPPGTERPVEYADDGDVVDLTGFNE